MRIRWIKELALKIVKNKLPKDNWQSLEPGLESKSADSQAKDFDHCPASWITVLSS
jgi:hypothetical protein